jgi:predicted branched-subunit amino acid permease
MTEWGLDFAMSVTFIGMVVPYLKSKPMWACVIVAAAMAIATATMPHKLGLLVAAIAGIAVGLSFHMMLKRQNTQQSENKEAS